MEGEGAGGGGEEGKLKEKENENENMESPSSMRVTASEKKRRFRLVYDGVGSNGEYGRAVSGYIGAVGRRKGRRDKVERQIDQLSLSPFQPMLPPPSFLKLNPTSLPPLFSTGKSSSSSSPYRSSTTPAARSSPDVSIARSPSTEEAFYSFRLPEPLPAGTPTTGRKGILREGQAPGTGNSVRFFS